MSQKQNEAMNAAIRRAAGRKPPEAEELPLSPGFDGGARKAADDPNQLMNEAIRQAAGRPR